SPYYIENQRFCKEFEYYIGSKSGLIKGTYNAFSYSIIGKIPHKNDWILNYRKSTFSNGNLFLSSEYQNLFVAVTGLQRILLPKNQTLKFERKNLLTYSVVNGT
ncbi:MAG: hypothetical protein JKY30_01600, partial [Flavobacteriales bacterium]|nr:hypothetical protein [Flavobacteriales bacterium]